MMYELDLTVLLTAVGIALLAVVYVWSKDPDRRGARLEPAQAPARPLTTRPEAAPDSLGLSAQEIASALTGTYSARNPNGRCASPMPCASIASLDRRNKRGTPQASSTPASPPEPMASARDWLVTAPSAVGRASVLRR